MPQDSGKPRASILVVDDIPDNITVLGASLSGLYEVRVATGGAAALEIAGSADPPDLILLDIMMPGMDGYEVCRRLKADLRTRRIPVVFVTSKTEDIDEELGLEAGGVDYLSKPVRPVVVRARVKNHLALAAAQRDLERQNEILQENLRLREEIDAISRHDLKSPLAAFFTGTAVLRKGKNLTPQQLGHLALLDRSAQRMLEMINRSLDLARMERGTYVVRSETVDLVKVIGLLVQQHAEEILDKSLRTRVRLGGRDLPECAECLIRGEEYLCISLFSNLLKNAIEASPPGQEILVAIDGPPSLRVEIRNQGEIPAEIRDRFFTRYATFGKKGGTGLGAYSARLMARTLGGDLSFTTSPERGTSLVFSLPCAPPCAPASEPPSEPGAV